MQRCKVNGVHLFVWETMRSAYDERYVNERSVL